MRVETMASCKIRILLISLMSTFASGNDRCIHISRGCLCQKWADVATFACKCQDGYSATNMLCHPTKSDVHIVPTLSCLRSTHCEVANLFLGGYCEDGHERHIANIFRDDVCKKKKEDVSWFILGGLWQSWKWILRHKGMAESTLVENVAHYMLIIYAPTIHHTEDYLQMSPA